MNIHSNVGRTSRSCFLPVCTGAVLLATNVPSNVQGMDLMVLLLESKPPIFMQMLVLAHLDHSTAAAQPALTLDSKVRCYPLP